MAEEVEKITYKRAHEVQEDSAREQAQREANRVMENVEPMAKDSKPPKTALQTMIHGVRLTGEKLKEMQPAVQKFAGVHKNAMGNLMGSDLFSTTKSKYKNVSGQLPMFKDPFVRSKRK